MISMQKTTVAEKILVDTSVLIGALDRSRPAHVACRRMVESGADFCTSAQVLKEFLAVATRPTTANGLGLSISVAQEELSKLRDRIALLPEERPLLPSLLDILAKTGACGRAVHDAGIVAAAVVHRVPLILTTDTQIFARYSSWVRVQAP